MTALPLVPSPSAQGRFDCHYFNANLCRSCSLLETPYPQQISDKEAWCREVLGAHITDADHWLSAATSTDHDFRNRAKLAVGGTSGAVTLGILDAEHHGVDLRECGIQAPAIRAVIPVLADLLDATGLDPYDVARRRGELKFVHVTAAPSGDLMVRFVVRSQFGLEVLASRTDTIAEAIPAATVLTVNLLPEHKAALEGSREVVLAGDSLRMDLGAVDLHLRPQSFFQTNTEVARALYAQVAAWVDEIDPGILWDLYCGVGGFALHCAGGASAAGAGDSENAGSDRATGTTRAARRVVGVEVSEQAIESAKVSAAELGVDARFIAADATEFAEAALGSASGAEDSDSPSALEPARALEPTPDCIIVNPPRRGIGARLSAVLEDSGVETLVYSSCNPLSLAKDLARMPSYEVVQARVFDMFPHTKHLEVAVLLQRR